MTATRARDSVLRLTAPERSLAKTTARLEKAEADNARLRTALSQCAEEAALTRVAMGARLTAICDIAEKALGGQTNG